VPLDVDEPRKDLVDRCRDRALEFELDGLHTTIFLAGGRLVRGARFSGGSPASHPRSDPYLTPAQVVSSTRPSVLGTGRT
jgi:hypothetical protein